MMEMLTYRAIRAAHGGRTVVCEDCANAEKSVLEALWPAADVVWCPGCGLLAFPVDTRLIDVQPRDDHGNIITKAETDEALQREQECAALRNEQGMVARLDSLGLDFTCICGKVSGRHDQGCMKYNGRRIEAAKMRARFPAPEPREIKVPNWPKAMLALHELQQEHPGATREFAPEGARWHGYVVTLPSGEIVRIRLTGVRQDTRRFRGEKTGGRADR